MDKGSLVQLSEVAKLSLGIESGSDTFGIIVDKVDLSDWFSLEKVDVTGYKVFVPGKKVEIVYSDDISEVINDSTQQDVRRQSVRPEK